MTTARRTLLVHIDPARHMAEVDACTCKFCVNDYYAVLAEAVEGGSNAEGIKIAICYSDRRNTGKAAEIHDLVCDMVADRIYRHPCGRYAQNQDPRGSEWDE
jgi:hypothetical protein